MLWNRSCFTARGATTVICSTGRLASLWGLCPPVTGRPAASRSCFRFCPFGIANLPVRMYVRTSALCLRRCARIGLHYVGYSLGRTCSPSGASALYCTACSSSMNMDPPLRPFIHCLNAQSLRSSGFLGRNLTCIFGFIWDSGQVKFTLLYRNWSDRRDVVCITFDRTVK